MQAADKAVNQMNRLTDMGHFPAVVNAGATANILLTLCVTWWVQPWLLGLSIGWWGQPWRLVPATMDRKGLLEAVSAGAFDTTLLPLLWVAAILVVNLLPVVLLRRTLRADTPYPSLGRMNFVHDQHKFSDWVYLAASANMAFWVLGGWMVFLWRRTPEVLFVVLAVAALATFAPVWLRAFRQR